MRDQAPLLPWRIKENLGEEWHTAKKRQEYLQKYRTRTARKSELNLGYFRLSKGNFRKSSRYLFIIENFIFVIIIIITIIILLLLIIITIIILIIIIIITIIILLIIIIYLFYLFIFFSRSSEIILVSNRSIFQFHVRHVCFAVWAYMSL